MSLFSKEIAIDLGTRNIVITCEDKVLIDDEAVIAVSYLPDGTLQLCALGRTASHALFRPYVHIIRPFKNGRVEDPVLFDLMFTAFVKKAVYLSRPKWVRFLIDIPGVFREAPALWVYLGNLPLYHRLGNLSFKFLILKKYVRSNYWRHHR